MGSTLVIYHRLKTGNGITTFGAVRPLFAANLVFNGCRSSLNHAREARIISPVLTN